MVCNYHFKRYLFYWFYYNQQQLQCIVEGIQYIVAFLYNIFALITRNITYYIARQISKFITIAVYMFCFTIANFYKYFYDSNSIYSVFSNIWFVINRAGNTLQLYGHVSSESINDERYTGLTHLEMFVWYIQYFIYMEYTYFVCFVYWIVYCLCITQIVSYFESVY